MTNHEMKTVLVSWFRVFVFLWQRKLCRGGAVAPRTQKVTSVDAWIIRANRRRIVTVRRGRGHRDAVTDHDRVIADEYLLDEQPHEALPIENVQRVRRHSQPGEKRRERLRELQ